MQLHSNPRKSDMSNFMSLQLPVSAEVNSGPFYRALGNPMLILLLVCNAAADLVQSALPWSVTAVGNTSP